MEVNVRLAGAAGQGLQTTADLLGQAVTRSGLYAYCYNDVESRIRGGLNFSHLRLSDKPLSGVSRRIDLLVAQTEAVIGQLSGGLSAEGLVLTQEDWPHPQAAPFNLAGLAEAAGSEKTAGVVALAVLAPLLGLERALIEDQVRQAFAGQEKLIEINLKAVEAGWRAAGELPGVERFRLPAGRGRGRLYLTGAQAVALGAVAGGCGFMSAYPMSPSTGIITNLAAWAEEIGLLTEQAEDEVAAINMVAGAAYAGARAMTATSGGGFCLMTEGVSLLGQIEVGSVIVIAQRPGPATGFPTRQAQGDLNLVRHAGQGFFPRIILAPRSIPECFSVTAWAFDLAERFQVPVFVLTDQLLQDSSLTVEPFSVEGLPRERHFLKRAELEGLKEYRRYALTESGLSPLAAPGASRHLVVVDSDEHDERGHINERADIGEQMSRKRLAKAGTVAAAAWAPEVSGQVEGRPLVVSWGSSQATVKEALARLAVQGRPAIHLSPTWLWPPSPAFIEAVREASRVIVVESSVGCEMSRLIREQALRPADAEIVRLDGRPFNLAELEQRLGEEVA